VISFRHRCCGEGNTTHNTAQSDTRAEDETPHNEGLQVQLELRRHVNFRRRLGTVGFLPPRGHREESSREEEEKKEKKTTTTTKEESRKERIRGRQGFHTSPGYCRCCSREGVKQKSQYQTEGETFTQLVLDAGHHSLGLESSDVRCFVVGLRLKIGEDET
jgi:hypothetical protein